MRVVDAPNMIAKYVCVLLYNWGFYLVSQLKIEKNVHTCFYLLRDSKRLNVETIPTQSTKAFYSPSFGVQQATIVVDYRQERMDTDWSALSNNRQWLELYQPQKILFMQVLPIILYRHSKQID